MRFHALFIPVYLLAFCVTPVLAGVPTPNNTVVQTYDMVIFNTSDQSIWDTTTSANDTFAFKWDLSRSDWKKFIGPVTNKISVGEVIEECVLGICGKAGLAAGLKLESYFLPYFDTVLQPGTFNASAAYQPTVQYQTSGLGLDFSSFETDAGLLNSAETRLLVRAPSIKVDAGINIENDLSLFAEACLVGCALDESWLIYSNKFKLPLLEINTKIDPVTGEKPVVKVFAPPQDTAELLEEFIGALSTLADNPDTSFGDLLGDAFYDDFSDLIWEQAADEYIERYDEDYKSATTEADRERIKDKAELDLVLALDAKKAQLKDSPLKATVSNPFLEDVESTAGTLEAQIGGRIAEITLDVDQLLGYAIGLPNGGSLSLSGLGIPTSALSGELTLGNVEVGPLFDIFTDVSVTPELMVELYFDAPVLVKGEIGLQSSYTGTWENLPDVALTAPEGPLTFDPTQDSIGSFFVNNGNSVTATPKFFVEAKVTNETYLNVNATAKIELFSAEIRIPGIGTENFGPVWQESVTTDSPLATVDLYSNQFASNDWWVSADGEIKEKYTPGATAYLVGDGAGSASSNDGALTLNAGGEVAFQARRKCGLCEVPEVAPNDSRVAPDLSTSGVRIANINQQPYGRNAFSEDSFKTYNEVAYDLGYFIDESINGTIRDYDGANQAYEQYQRLLDQYFPDLSGYVLTDDNVRAATYDRLQIEPGQLAQVMRDGQLRVNDDFVVEAGGLLELGTDPLVLSSFLEQGRGLIIQQGAELAVHGTVYGANSAEKGALSAQSGSLGDAYAVVNEGDMRIGYTGSVKVDGTFSNTGAVNNSGTLELTSDDASSSGSLYIGATGELAVYGTLEARSAQNRGTVNVNTGGSLLLTDLGDSSNGDARVDNFGELRVHEGALLQIAPGSGKDYLLNNQFVVENQGYMSNQAGGRIVNGAAGYDWSQWVDELDVLGVARNQRAAALSEWVAPLQAQNNAVFSAVAQAELARQQFITASNIAVSGIEANLRPLSQMQAGAIYSLLTTINNYGDAHTVALALVQAQKPLFDTLALALKAGAGLGPTFTDAQNKEAAFGSAVAEAATQRGALDSLLTAMSIEVYQQAQSGFGLINNGPGALLVNDSTIINHAVLENDFSGAVYNAGALDNTGLLKNRGELVNQAGASLTNSGLLVNGMVGIGPTGFSSLSNLGTLDNRAALLNEDVLDNYGVLVNHGASGAQPLASTLYNAGQLHNFGEITNDGQLINDADAGLVNHSRIVNNGTVTNLGTFSNGAIAGPAEGQTPVSLSAFLTLAGTYFGANQSMAEAERELPRLQEELKDSRARAGLIEDVSEVFTLCFGCNFNVQQLVDAVFAQRDSAIAYYQNLEAGLVNRILALQGDLSQDLAAPDRALLDSASVASLENNGVFNNVGILNNVGTVENNDGGELRNSGMLLVSDGATIDNRGTLTLEREALLNQEGLLLSTGTINNSGLIEVSAGSLVNGAPGTGAGTINNAGTLRLAGSVTPVVTAQGFSVTVEEASLVNHGRINNITGGVVEIGTDDALVQASGLIGVSALANYGELINNESAHITNRGVLYNDGLIDNLYGSIFENEGFLENTENGEIRFAESTTLGGSIFNDGLIAMSDGALLTISGNISGRGSFTGDTLIQGMGPGERERATVNPGNSPGLSTFAGNVSSGENVNWVMEIWGTERGVSYDAVDIDGDFKLLADLSLTVLSILSFEELLDQEFTYFSIVGDLLNAVGETYTDSFGFTGFSDLSKGWTGTWVKGDTMGWNLNLAFTSAANAQESFAVYSAAVADYAQLLGPRAAAAVPTPGTLQVLALGLMLLAWSRRRAFRSPNL
jgi:hypothetical protein